MPRIEPIQVGRDAAIPDLNGHKKVLVIAFLFPPHGGGGVQRTAYFTKYLPESGWRPHVLTGPIGEYYRLQDRSLLDVIPGDIAVTRTGYFDTRRVFRALGKVHLASVAKAVSLSFPSAYSGWIPHAYKTGLELLQRERFDLIYSSAYPICSHVVAFLLKKKTGLPWVADYRDEWSIRDVLKWPTPLHHRIGRRLDRMLVSAANRVVTTSPAHTERFADEFSAMEPEKFITVTNGFEESDFGGAAVRSACEQRSDAFVISHIGSLNSWRNAGSFLAAVRRLVDAGDIPAERVKVKFVGNGRVRGGDDLKRRDIVQDMGYVNHKEAIASMSRSDALLLINTESTNIPGKTFEYLASGKPILALVRPGPTAHIVKKTGAGIVVSPDDVDQIADAIRRMYSAWSTGRLDWGVDRNSIGSYSRRRTTQQLGQILTEASAVARQPASRTSSLPLHQAAAN